MKLAFYCAIAVTLSRFGWLLAEFAAERIEAAYNRHIKRSTLFKGE